MKLPRLFPSVTQSVALLASVSLYSAAFADDYIFTNAKVYTVDQAQPWAEAVVVDDTRITFVGDTETALTFRDADTQVIDVDGRMMMPGLNDIHTHPGVAGLATALGVFLRPNMRISDYQDAIKQYADANPDAPVIAGFGYIPPVFGPGGPSKELLDSVVPDRPVFIISGFGHSAWANSKALEVLNITRDTPDPVPGAHFYRRDTNGEPTGHLVEGAAFWSHLSALGLGTPEQFLAGYQRVLPDFATVGITSLFDAGTPSVQENAFIALRELEAGGQLNIRYNGSFYVIDGADADVAVAEVERLRNTYDSDLLRITGIKVSNDGQSPDPSKSHLLFDRAQLGDIFTRIAEADLNVMVHATTPFTVTQTLDGMEMARAAQPDTESRFIITHMDPIMKSDFPRFAELDVIGAVNFEGNNLNFQHRNPAVFEDNTLMVGTARSFIEAGVVLTSGSDFPACGRPITGCTPFHAMEVGLTRLGLGLTEGDPMAPAQESISLEQSIHAYTKSAAYQMDQEDDLGSISVGKLADVIVLDRNLFEIEPYTIHEAKVLMTMINGRVVHNLLP